nr:hypothetical protein [uncultured Methylotenera sp.]
MTHNPSFQEVMGLLTNPLVMTQLNMFLADSYEEWVQLFYKHLDLSVTSMQDAAKYYPKECKDDDEAAIYQTEDSLTHHLINPLRQLGYAITHDTFKNGHVDINVERNSYVWLGEAKIYTSYAKLIDGYKQLTTRYSTGEPHQNHGGIVIYHYQPNANATMQNWRTKLIEYDNNIQISECPTRTGLCFYSANAHLASGLDYKIRHMPIMLFNKPLK